MVNFMGGYKVVTTPIIEEMKERELRTWTDKVLSWNPCNKFEDDKKVPSSNIFIDESRKIMYMHPLTLEEFKVKLNEIPPYGLL